MSRRVARAPRGSQEERGARERRHWRPQSFVFFSRSSRLCERAHFLFLSLSLSSPSTKQPKMSFAMTANFFYAIVVAGLAYNVFILYAGASAAKLALSK